jgi:phosphinothricin acetyltransferase
VGILSRPRAGVSWFVVSLPVRPAADADLPAITAIYAEAVANGTASFELDPPGEDEMRRRREALLVGGFPYLVAEADGSVVGYAHAGPYRPRAAYRSTVEDSVYVAPCARGRGVGRALLQTLIEDCEGRDFRLMVAVIGDEASTGSIRLHRALGFGLVGTFTGIGYKHGRWLACILMQRALGPGVLTPPTRPVRR